MNGSSQIQEYNSGTLSIYATLPSGTSLNGVAVDSAGAVYYSVSDSSGAPFVAKTGSSTVNFGSVAIGSSSSMSLPFTIAASSSTTVTSMAILTDGASGMDFSDAGGSTCTAKTYATSTNCTVNVKLTPRFAGLRRGAVLFFNGNTVLSTTYIYGVGTGPQVVFPSNSGSKAIGNGFSNPGSVAVDGSGNVFVADTDHSEVKELSLATPPSLSFPATDVGSQSATHSITVANDGNAALTFPIPVSGNNPSIAANFMLDSTTSCLQLNSSSGAAGSLAPGASCNYAVDFVPSTTGNISGTAALTDNHLNAAAPNYAT